MSRFIIRAYIDAGGNEGYEMVDEFKSTYAYTIRQLDNTHVVHLDLPKNISYSPHEVSHIRDGLDDLITECTRDVNYPNTRIDEDAEPYGSTDVVDRMYPDKRFAVTYLVKGEEGFKTANKDLTYGHALKVYGRLKHNTSVERIRIVEMGLDDA